MKKIFITGGAGYVGSALTPYLLDKGYKVTVFDLMIYGDDLIKNHENLTVVKGDIRNFDLLKKVVPDNDIVIHLACISNDPSFELNPKLGKSINLEAFEPLVKISKNNSVKRFIYASSSSVYGLKDEKNVHEKMKLEPLTDYSKFKVDCENILQKYNSSDFTTTIIRPATVCGYAPRQRFDVIVNILTNLAYHKKKITVFGGSQLRPNININDMVRVYSSLIEAPVSKIDCEIFNAGIENKTVMELAQIVKKTVGDDVTLEISPTDDNRSYHISSEKIQNQLNFKFEFTIVDAVNGLIEAFEKKLLLDTLTNKKYFNIKTMNSINLT
jgi:nucleoside-diphosphate-sugar epimerase|tara:strand:+ start:944 stop:1924 length:981 start_codon:yes stop_codon:yes gene_type:complete